jgi:hypothetical protein
MLTTTSSRRRAAALLLSPVIAMSLWGCGSWRGEQIFVVGPEQLKKDNPLSASFGVKGNYTYEQVWKAAMTAMSNGMTVMESHKPSGEIKSRIGAAPSGKVVGFWITPTTPTAATYTIQTLSVRPIGLTTTGGTGWEPKVVEDFNAALNAR